MPYPMVAPRTLATTATTPTPTTLSWPASA